MRLSRKLDKVKRTIHRWLSAVYDEPLEPATDRERDLAGDLKAAFHDLTSEERADQSSSEDEWLDNVDRLRELVLNDDPREFLRWDVIVRTMCVTYASYISPELHYLRSRPDWESRWYEATKESPVGHPVPYWRHPCSSENLIHHAYHLAQLEEKIGMRVDNMNCIFEFGGGYGGMCRLAHNLGFRGKYVIFDLPAFSALQRFYLRSIPLAVHSTDSFNTEGDGIVCISSEEKLRTVLSNHFDVGSSMFIATWSISEAPVNLRNSVLSLVSSFKVFLIAYQSRFGEINNLDFFKSWSELQKDVQWYDWKIEQIRGNNRYIVGWRKTS